MRLKQSQYSNHAPGRKSLVRSFCKDWEFLIKRRFQACSDFGPYSARSRPFPRNWYFCHIRQRFSKLNKKYLAGNELSNCRELITCGNPHNAKMFFNNRIRFLTLFSSKPTLELLTSTISKGVSRAILKSYPDERELSMFLTTHRFIKIFKRKTNFSIVSDFGQTQLETYSFPELRTCTIWTSAFQSYIQKIYWRKRNC